MNLTTIEKRLRRMEANPDLAQEIFKILNDGQIKCGLLNKAPIHYGACDYALAVAAPFMQDANVKQIIAEEYENYARPAPGKQRGEYTPREGDLKFCDLVGDTNDTQRQIALPKARY